MSKPRANTQSLAGKQTEEEYQAERSRAQHLKIGMSMDRMLGRRPADLPGRRRMREILGDEFTKTDNSYDPLRRRGGSPLRRGW